MEVQNLMLVKHLPAGWYFSSQGNGAECSDSKTLTKLGAYLHLVFKNQFKFFFCFGVQNIRGWKTLQTVVLKS